MLLSCGSWRKGESWADHLPRLLEPMGVLTVRVHSGREATRALAAGQPFHIAVVDLALPIEGAPAPAAPDAEEGGPRILQLLARLEAPPPTIVVKRALTQRDDARQLAEALRLGAFAVVDRPVNMELMLEIFRRVLHRHYHDRWPGGGPSTS